MGLFHSNVSKVIHEIKFKYYSFVLASKQIHIQYF